MEKKITKIMLAILINSVSAAALSTPVNLTPVNDSKPKNNRTKPATNNTQDSETQIGASFFQLATTKTTPIRQIGIANEQHSQFAVIYLLLNQLLANRLFYELRVYSIYHYRTGTPPKPPVVPTAIPTSSERNILGYGGLGILGYNIDLTSKLSLLPFVRLQALTNTTAAYKDTYGNGIQSADYTAFLGGKLSMKVTPEFATYASYFAGYNWTTITGQGVYSNAGGPSINGFMSILELGAPYKFNKLWSLTPYMQFITFAANANAAAASAPYNQNSLTSTSSVYAVRLTYVF